MWISISNIITLLTLKMFHRFQIFLTLKILKILCLLLFQACFCPASPLISSSRNPQTPSYPLLYWEEPILPKTNTRAQWRFTKIKTTGSLGSTILLIERRGEARQKQAWKRRRERESKKFFWLRERVGEREEEGACREKRERECV